MRSHEVESAVSKRCDVFVVKIVGQAKKSIPGIDATVWTEQLGVTQRLVDLEPFIAQEEA